jgi:hypothetical protein
MIEPIFELRFESLFKAGSGYSFRCDAQGKVELDQMSHRCRTNYLYARAMVGHEFAMPLVIPTDGAHLRPDAVKA